MYEVTGRCLRPAKAAEKLGIGQSTLWYWVKTDPDFPKPIKLGRNTTVFLEEELDCYLAHCAAQCRSDPSGCGPIVSHGAISKEGAQKLNAAGLNLKASAADGEGVYGLAE